MAIPAPITAAAPSRALSFDRAAAQYAAARPGYPPALLDAVEELSGRPLRGSRAVDVGAGTGIATRLLEARGALVTAVEPGPGMAAELHRALPSVPLVRGDGNRLPLAAASADLITYAQSWHWTDQARALPEALRYCGPAAPSRSGGTSPTTPSPGSPPRGRASPATSARTPSRTARRFPCPRALAPTPNTCAGCPAEPCSGCFPGPGRCRSRRISPTSPPTRYSSYGEPPPRSPRAASSPRSTNTSPRSSPTAWSRNATWSTYGWSSADP